MLDLCSSEVDCEADPENMYCCPLQAGASDSPAPFILLTAGAGLNRTRKHCEGGGGFDLR